MPELKCNMITNEERERIIDQFDIYDLVELLDISVGEFIDVFDFKIVECDEIMEKVNEFAGGAREEAFED